VPPEIGNPEVGARGAREAATVFEDLPDSPLPPVHLLDEAAGDIQVLSAGHARIHLAPDREEAARLRHRSEGRRAQPGPVITRFEIEPAVGVKGSQIVNLVKDLARALSVVSIRCGRDHSQQDVHGSGDSESEAAGGAIVEIVSSQAYADMGSPLDARARQGHRRQADRRRSPTHAPPAGGRNHRLGQVGGDQRHDLSLLYKATPNDVRMILVDPKMLELSVYEGIPHLLAPVVIDMKQAAKRAQLVRGREGAALQADVDPGCAQSVGLQSEGEGCGEGGQPLPRSVRDTNRSGADAEGAAVAGGRDR
jgi:S-DNA-T family DNA segregation ATPase FtsK/SpoIIIE